jgi:molybdenum cofactor cytidylyltransferase
VLLVDQPLIKPELIDRLVAAFEQDPSSLAVVPRHQGRRGNPVLIAAGLFAELQALTGDTGARTLFERHAAQVRWLDVDDPAILIDADTPEAFARLEQDEGGQSEASSP